MLNLDHNFTIQKDKPWIPYELEQMPEEMRSAKTPDDIRGSFKYYGQTENELEWKPNEHGPEQYVFNERMSANINESASESRGEPLFSSLYYYQHQLAEFWPLADLDTAKKAMWFFCAGIHSTTSRLEYLQKAGELSMHPNEYELQRFLTPPAISDYSENGRSEYLAERQYLAKYASERMTWETEEFLVGEPDKWHPPHHDTRAEIIGKADIENIRCRMHGMSVCGIDITSYVDDIDLGYASWRTTDLTADIKEMEYRPEDRTVAIQTAPMGWHGLTVEFNDDTVHALGSRKITDINEGSVYDIAAITRWADSFILISGRGILRTYDYYSQDNKCVFLLPANTNTMHIFGLETEDMTEEAESEAWDKIEQLKEETAQAAID